MKVETLAEAKRLSIIKWEYYAENGPCDPSYAPQLIELIGLIHNCGFCQYQMDHMVENVDSLMCDNCRLNTRNTKHDVPANNCCGGLFSDYIDQPDGSKEQKEIGIKILDLIRSVKV